MPIRVRLDHLLLERRMSLAELADRTGVSAANLALLKSGEAQAVRVATLDALCRELRCQPGDLVVYEAQDGEAGPHPAPPDML
jgi:putative transcriptional regulator